MGNRRFKATPGSGDLFAHTIANDEPHKLNAAFNINRFVSGDLVDEHGAAAVAHQCFSLIVRTVVRENKVNSKLVEKLI